MEIPWPEDGDEAFPDSPSPRACHMRVGGSSGLSIIADGFKEASDILVEYLQQSTRNDALVHPIIFGYRHCLELRIKALAATVNEFDTGQPEFKRGHRLADLWNNIRPRLLEELEEEEKEAFSVVEQVIMKFHEIDKQGDGFRYPDVVNQFNIDLENMREVVSKASTFLESFNDFLEASL